MSEERRAALKETIRLEIKKVQKDINEFKENFAKADSDMSEEILKQRDAKRKILEGLSKLFDEVDDVDANLIETEYNVISTDKDDTFIVIYLDPKTNKVTFSSSSVNKEDALNCLKERVEEVEGDKIKEKVSDGS